MVAAKRLQLGCSHKAEDSCGFLVFLAVPRAQPIWILWNTQPLSEVHGKTDKTVGWKKGKRKKSATNGSLEFVQVKSNKQSQTSTEIFWCWIQLYFKGRGLRAPGTTSRSPTGAGVQQPGPPAAAFPGALPGSWTSSWAARTWTGSMGAGGSYTASTTKPASASTCTGS